MIPRGYYKAVVALLLAAAALMLVRGPDAAEAIRYHQKIAFAIGMGLGWAWRG